MRWQAIMGFQHFHDKIPHSYGSIFKSETAKSYPIAYNAISSKDIWKFRPLKDGQLDETWGPF